MAGTSPAMTRALARSVGITHVSRAWRSTKHSEVLRCARETQPTRLPAWQVYEAALSAAFLARAAETGIDPAGICRAAAEFGAAAARQTVRVAAFARRPCTVGGDRSQSGRHHREGQEGFQARHHCQLLFPGRA